MKRRSLVRNPPPLLCGHVKKKKKKPGEKRIYSVGSFNQPHKIKKLISINKKNKKKKRRRRRTEKCIFVFKINFFYIKRGRGHVINSREEIYICRN